MDEIMIRTPDGTLHRYADPQPLPRLERLKHQLQEAKKVPEAIIYLKRGRYLREIKRNTIVKQHKLFL
jgi:hypothetical protein